VWQIFQGTGTVELNGASFIVDPGDVIAVPSWTKLQMRADDYGLDVFMFSDAPIFEKLGLLRSVASES
jgi:gentisate 1,2-dioxygenase